MLYAYADIIPALAATDLDPLDRASVRWSDTRYAVRDAEHRGLIRAVRTGDDLDGYTIVNR